MQRRSHGAWESLPLAAIRVDEGGRIVATNPQAARLGLCVGVLWPALCAVAGSVDLAHDGRVWRVWRHEGSPVVLLEERTAGDAIGASILREMQHAHLAAVLARVGSWILDLKEMRVSWSAEVRRMLDLDLDFVPTLDSAIAFYAPEVQPTVREVVRRSAETGTPWEFELPMITAHGRRIWARVIGEPEHENGRPVRLVGVMQDVTERRLAEESREQARARARSWEALVQMSGGLALIADGDGVVRQVNEAWTTRLGWAADAVVGRTLLHLTHGEDVPASLAAFERLRRTPTSPTVNWSARARAFDGRTVWMAWTARFDAVAGRIYAFGTDITRLKEHEVQLAEMALRAERANDAKGAFLAAMSHEVRTPLNGMLGLASLLQSTPLDEEQLGWASQIEAVGRTLLALLNDVLDFSRVDAGRLELEPVHFSLPDVVHDVVVLYEARVRGKGLRLRVDVDEDVPAMLGDAGRVRQVLVHLMDNAVKFTPFGEVCLSASGRRVEDHVDLRLTVSDTGVGIPARLLPELFQPFVQGKRDGQGGGTGLGLAICRQLTALMGGTIAVDSREGAGASFEVRLRLPVAPPPIADPNPVTRWSGLRALVVDDNPVNRIVAAGMLRQLGCAVEEAADGEEALVRLGRSATDLVLMDCFMPGLDGIEVTRRLRAVGGVQPVVIALTANALPGYRERCLGAGMDGFLVKPLVMDALAHAVERLAQSGRLPIVVRS